MHNKGPGVRTDGVQIPAGPIALHGELTAPPGARGIVIVGYRRALAQAYADLGAVAALQASGLGTLWVNLLPEETNVESPPEVHAELHPRVGLLVSRLAAVARWAAENLPGSRAGLGVFAFAADTGAALAAAALDDVRIGALVCVAGRPDLAGDALQHVRAPTLLIVGENDEPVATLNRYTQHELSSEKRLEVVRGATHTFEQRESRERVASLASDWFLTHFGTR
ncbi:hydrolase [Opitutaceae bacterium EW11]|nr:hydrolase [Opitutaceae bacterium EW11]